MKKQKHPKHLTYDLAYDELIRIQTALENDQVPTAKLSSVVERAEELIRFCKKGQGAA